jgi:D-cysteine desulfhydrase family pyridoxal phosphate-dependent enzyme
MVDTNKKAEVKSLIRKFPRVSLGIYPTPLHPAPRLSEFLEGPRIYFKREDLSGLALGGNKTRMLEFRMGKMLDAKADTVIGGWHVQSNHARQLAAACSKLGLKCHLVLRKAKGEKGWNCQGNLLLDGLCGAQVEVLNAGEKEHWECMMELADQLRRKGCVPYITGEPDRYLSAVAYVDCVVETYEQLEKLDAFPDYIFVCSSNTTLAGLLLGVKCLGINVRVIGIDHGWVSGREVARERVLASANEAAERMGVAERVNKGDVVLLRNYIGEGYGKITEEAVEAILIVARSEGVLLDPVYTSKAMAGLIDQVRKDKVGTEETVLFIHTGGFPSIFVYNRELGKYFSVKERTLFRGG